MVKEKISAMSDEHTGWLSALDFYKTELNGVKAKLTEIAGKNTSKEIGAQLEHYENQIKIQQQNIDELHHNINENLSKVAAQLKENTAGYIDAALVKIHDGQKDTFAGIEKVVNELRQEFNRFASQWM